MRRSVARFLGGREGGREGRFRFFSNNFFRRSDFDFERLKMVEGRGEKGGRGGGKNRPHRFCPPRRLSVYH